MSAGNSRRASEAYTSYGPLRENQRRSRCVSYTQHLEQQLLSIERHNVDKTLVFQEAREKMTRENSLLRSLLILYGLTETDIEAHLRSQRQQTDSSSQGQLKTTPVAAKSPPPTPQCHALLDGHNMSALSSNMGTGSPELISPSASNSASDRTAVSPGAQDKMQSNLKD